MTLFFYCFRGEPNFSGSHFTRTTTLKSSPAIPIHHFGFVVGKFSSISLENRHFFDEPIPTRTYFRYGLNEYLGAQGSTIIFGTTVSTDVLQQLIRYLKPGVHPKKLDNVIIQNLNENTLNSWGLLYHREDEFLQAKNSYYFMTRAHNKDLFLSSESDARDFVYARPNVFSSLHDKHRILLRIAEKSTHHFIRNLLIPNECEHAWIAEGLSHFLSYRVVSTWRVEELGDTVEVHRKVDFNAVTEGGYGSMDTMIVESCFAALGYDAKRITHKMSSSQYSRAITQRKGKY